MNRPIVFSELNDRVPREDGTSAAEIVEMVAPHNYDILDPLDLSRSFSSHEFGDMLCIPQ
ncbi:MAG: hypothetical protein KDA44_17270 [Planctomycetales bacterium]|nr:hypothetical protein [Planctomycetales bacterium]